MKCRVCRGPAVIDLRRHNANFCPEHFLEFTRKQVAKAIEDFEMFGPDDRVLVAVSGGAVAIWDLLLDLGYEADGFSIGLGFGEYSSESSTYSRAFAGAKEPHRGRPPRHLRLRHPRRPCHPTCAVRRAGSRSATCSTRRRSTAATTVVVTGHNLDDEAAVLYGNVLTWQADYLGRQMPGAAGP